MSFSNPNPAMPFCKAKRHPGGCLRHPPGQGKNVMFCSNSDDEPEARAAMIWIVGEYAERIDNADEILQSFLDGFHDENTQSDLYLTALYLAAPLFNGRINFPRIFFKFFLKFF
eukprot:sb/3476838/